MDTLFTITGSQALEVAEKLNVTLHKFADPTEDARVVSASEARDIAREDPGLIYASAEEALEKCDTTNDLDVLVDAAADCAGVELREDLSWGEDAQRIEDENPDFAEFLRRAEARWFEIEQ